MKRVTARHSLVVVPLRLRSRKTIEQADDDGQAHELGRSGTCEPLRLLPLLQHQCVRR
jgi:hypothetical protein